MSKTKFEQFNREQRLDLFYADILACHDKMQDSWTMVKIILCGNAAVEGGFSINKELLIDNMTEETIVSQRVVFDAIHAAGMVVIKVDDRRCQTGKCTVRDGTASKAAATD